MINENERMDDLRKELYKGLHILRVEQNDFKKRISVIANLFIPGIGFFIYGKSVLKGIISIVLFFFASVYLRFGMYETEFMFYIPAIIIYIVSTAMVASLKD